MCWQLEIEIIALQEVKRYQDSFLEQLAFPLIVSGSFPSYHLSDGHCLCKVFRNDSDLTDIIAFVTAIARNPQTKKLSVLKYWSNKPESTELIKLSAQQFETRTSLEQDTKIEVTDMMKFRFH